MPFITKTPLKIFEGLGVEAPTIFEGNLVCGKVEQYQTKEIGILFPRIDVEKELKEMEKLAEIKEEKVEEKKEEVVEEKVEYISADEFFRTKLVVGEILACERVPKADKLLKSTVKIGNEIRTILSGIAQYYTPEEMVGKRVVVVSNLAPRKIRGIESQGMLLCAATDDDLCLVTPEKLMESGTEVC